jgi:hypothetical protein
MTLSPCLLPKKSHRLQAILGCEATGLDHPQLRAKDSAEPLSHHRLLLQTSPLDVFIHKATISQ